MYILEDFIDMGLEDESWSSDDHRKVASTICLCNPNVFSMEKLCNNVQIINHISMNRIIEV